MGGSLLDRVGGGLNVMTGRFFCAWNMSGRNTARFDGKGICDRGEGCVWDWSGNCK